MRTDGAFGRRSLTFSFIAPRSDASRFRSFGPITRHSAGLFYVSPKLRAFFLSFSLSFLQITPVTMPIHTPHFSTKNARLTPGLMPQPSAAYGSAGDWRSAGGLFGETLLRCRPANPLAALRHHPEALARIEAALGRADFNAWGASALTAFAADCAVWTNEAFGQRLLARGLALTGDAAAAAAALPQPAGLNPVEIDQLRQARRRTVFLGALAAAWEPITEIIAEAGQGRADRWQPLECWAPETEFLAEFVLRNVRIGRIVRGKYAEEPSAGPFDISSKHPKSETKRRALLSILARIRRASSRSRASEAQWNNVTETNFDRRWEAALDDEILGLPAGSEEGRLLARILTDARRRRLIGGAPRLPSEILRMASSAEGRTLFSKAFAQRVAEGEVLPVDAAADEAGQKGFAVRQRRASPEDSRDDSAEKPNASASAEAHRKPRLWWAADGWWLEWPRGGRLLAETAVGIYPAAEPYLSLHGQDEDEREERSLRAAALFAAAEVLGLSVSLPIKPRKLKLPNKPAALPLRPSRELEAAFLTVAARSRLSPEQHQNRARAVKALSESPETEISGSGADSARTANELWAALDARLMRLARAAQPIARALGPDGARGRHMAGNPVGFIPRPEVSAAKPPKNTEHEEGCGFFCFEQADGTEADDDALDSEHSQPKLRVMEEPQIPMPQLDDCEWIIGVGAEAGLAGDAVSAALEHLKDLGVLTSEITTFNPPGVFLPESAFEDSFERLRAFLSASTLLVRRTGANAGLAPWIWHRADKNGLVEAGLLLNPAALTLIRRHPAGGSERIVGDKRWRLTAQGVEALWIGM